MKSIFNFIATVATFVTGLFATSPKMNVVPFTDADFPHAPTSTKHVTNDYEDTLSFEVFGDYTVDVCTILDTPDELVINITDEVGNQVAGVVLTPGIIQNYLSNLSQAHAIA